MLVEYDLVQRPDASALLQVGRAMGAPWTPSEIARRVDLAGDGVFLAQHASGAVVGCSLAFLWPPRAGLSEAEQRSLAWVSGMLVLPAHRRRGLARSLLRYARDHAERGGAQVIGLDATPEAQPLYEQAGFEEVGETVRWVRRRGRTRPDPGSSGRFAIYPVSSCELMELLDYDAPRFGASRARLLASLIAEFPHRSFVAVDRSSGAFSGFVLGMEDRVGPLVADAPEAAEWLLFACERAGTPPVAHVNHLNKRSTQLFQEAGYEPELTAIRMVRGGPLPGRQGEIYGVSWATG